tara:strand:+ start:31642 stop:32103 length:462 start_codon:yes stop_codon:yes gene_type:complete
MYQVQIIEDLEAEPVTLAEVKTFMTIDYTDFDDLLTSLITSAREESEEATGKAYGAKLIQVTGNDIIGITGIIEKVYPITPFISDGVWADESGNIDYQYNAGYSTVPQPLKIAIMARVATDFVYRQGITNEPRMAVWSAYIAKEFKYRTALCV